MTDAGQVGTGRVPAALRGGAMTAAPTLLVLVMSASSLAATDGVTGWWSLAVLLGQALPLLVVRRAPLLVLVWTASLTAGALAAGLPVTNGTAAQAIATAVVVARTPWPVSIVVPVAVLATSTVGASVGYGGDVLRFDVVTGASLLLGWIFGDAARRRGALRVAMEAELARRAGHHRLRSEVGALTERLSIARELHGLVGNGLDAVVIQAGAARALVGRPEAAQLITGIETAAREVLGDLDRFLALLRQDVPERQSDRDARPAPVEIAESRRIDWVDAHAPILTLVGSAAAVAGLTYLDVAGVPASHPVPAWWPLAFSVAIGAPLLWRSRSPEVALAVVTVLATAHLAAGIPIDNGVIAIAVAAHGVITHRSRRRSILLASVACALPTVATALRAPSEAVQLGTVLAVLTAVGLYAGDTARVARQHNGTLAQRLADVEAEGHLRRHAVVVEERTRAARDLHDSVGHTLSLIVIQAGAARLGATSTTPGAQERVAGALDAIESAARSALEALERSVHPVEGDDADVPPSGADLDRLIDGVRAAGTTVDVTALETADLPRSLQTTVFRLVQEALTNVVKHAPGARAAVHVDRSSDVVRVRVTNAAGESTEPGLPSGGRGLTGMRERVALFGGHLDVGPDGSGGYVVDAAIRIPVPVDAVPTTLHTAEENA